MGALGDFAGACDLGVDPGLNRTVGRDQGRRDSEALAAEDRDSDYQAHDGSVYPTAPFESQPDGKGVPALQRHTDERPVGAASQSGKVKRLAAGLAGDGD